MTIFDDNIRAATNAAKNPNSIVNNTSRVSGISSSTSNTASIPGMQVAVQLPGSVSNRNLPNAPTIPSQAKGSQPQTEI